MSELIQKFIDITNEPYQWLRKWKTDNQKKVIGCFPMYVPEEMIHSLGILPVTVQRSMERITLSPRVIDSYFCDFSRSTMDLFLRGELDFLDGVVLGDTCCASRAISQIIQSERRDLYEYDIMLPGVLNSATYRDFLFEELGRFKDSLEKFAGRKITEASLKKSCELYNQDRALLRKLYELRRSKPGLLNGKEILAVVTASMIMPKEEHIELLSQLLAELENRKPGAQNGTKVVVSGALCEAAQVELLDLIEDLGGIIVDDDLYVGSRYFAVDCSDSKDAMTSVADRYWNMVPCPTKYNPQKDYGKYILNIVKKSKAQGVVILLVLHCEPHWWAYPVVKTSLDEAEIPYFYLETEQESVSPARIRTRMEAFMEMMKKGGKGK